jgi:hypothetical protein
MTQRILDFLGLCSPYLLGTVPLLVCLLLLSGCASNAGGPNRTGNILTTAATTAGGAYVGANNSKDKAKGAAIGAAVGLLTGESINFLNNKAQKEAFISGYEKGQSDAVKQQYWISRDNQRPQADEGYEETYYEIEVPQSDRDGVRREATKRVIRILTPKNAS